jgi:hypothetical protein
MWWCVTLVIFGAYWFVRNWAHWHNPVPWMRVNIGPIDLPQRFHLTPSIVKFLGQWSEWRAWIFPGFATALGRSWWLILGLAFVGAIFAVARGPSLVERAVGASVLVGVVTVAFIQTGSDFAGAVFVFMVRYIEPALLVGFVLVVRALARAPDWVRRAITIVFVALTIVGTTSTYPELPAWPTHELLVAIVVVALTLGLIGVIRRTPNQAISVFAAAALVVVGAGWVVQRHYFSRRYIDAGLPHDHLNAFFQPISGARVDVLGTEHFYPIIGANLANNVVRELPTPTGAAASDCRAWRELLTRSGFDYVVIAHDPFSAGIQDPSWISTDPAATIVLQEQDVSVYEIRGRFEPNGCPPA